MMRVQLVLPDGLRLHVRLIRFWTSFSKSADYEGLRYQRLGVLATCVPQTLQNVDETGIEWPQTEHRSDGSVL